MPSAPPGRLLAVVWVATFAGLAACSAEVATAIPRSDGTVAGGAKESPPAADAGSSSTPPPGSGSSGSSSGGAGSSGGSVPEAGTPTGAVEASAPVVPDAGVPTYDAGSPGTPPSSGPPGSCGNPVCGTDGNECGCTATDSQGNTVQLGCQTGGQCGCFVNQQLTGQPTDENGACTDQASTRSEFLTDCTCQ